MNNSDFNKFETSTIMELIPLLDSLKLQIGNEYRSSDDINDDTPAMQITISTDNSLLHWNYQTGDNSYTGNCYSDPYWGIATLTRESDTSSVAKELIDSLAEQIEFE
jgi:hypothetical protein